MVTVDHRSRSARNMLAAAPLDRLHARRKDARWLEERLADPGSRVTFLWRLKSLVTREDPPAPPVLAPAAFEELLGAGAQLLLLGQEGRTVWFGIDLPPEAPPPESVASLGVFRDLRELGPLLEPSQGSLLAHLRGLAFWHRRHLFCGTCGTETRSAEAGHLRVCTNTACGELHFPRTDPAIIALVTHGDRCLLGRQAVWPEGRYSTVAGFVEPGESLEEAVVREVGEETGVVVGRVEYHSSQPWPFPASLMLGFRAEARTDEIRLDDELADARWFSRQELAEAVRAGSLKLPGTVSIAYRLLEDWFDREGGPTLGSLANATW